MPDDPSRTIRFGVFSIPPDVDVLYRGETVVPLEPQAVRVLRYLAERQGDVVSKEELLDNVWPDVFTTDGVLKKAVSLIRRAIGDDATRPGLLETHHRRGYRLVAPADAPSSDEPVADRTPLAGAPRRATRFVGRREEIAELASRLDESRVMTLVGPGGIGKTRLSLELASAVRDRYHDGVWFIELAPLVDDDSVVRAAASKAGMRGDRHVSADELADAVRGRDALLVLDNCEHVVEACARLADAIVGAGPGPRILATSREPLGIEGEAVWRVPPLGSGDAAALFADRARLTDASFDVTSGNAGAIAALCARLEGNPLAIELAAARARMMPLEQMLSRIDDSLDLLAGATRTGPARHRTLRAAIEWSYALLSSEEQALLRALAVFVGGFDLEAAEALEEEMRAWRSDQWGTVGVRLRRTPTLDLLTQLVDKSLVVADTRGTTARYEMPGSIRRFARKELRECGEETAAEARHLSWALGLAERAGPGLSGPDQVAWLNRLSVDHANLRTAWHSAAATRDAEVCARFTAALPVYWATRGLWRDARACAARAIEGLEALPPALQAGALRGAASLALRAGDARTGAAHAEAALAIVREHEGELETARLLRILSSAVSECGDYDRAETLMEEALAIFRARGRPTDVARALGNLAFVAMLRGDLDRATAVYEESLALSREAGLVRSTGVALHNLADIAWQQGALSRAGTLMVEAIEVARRTEDRQLVAQSLQILGCVEAELGEADRALERFAEAVPLFREIGDERYVALVVESAAVAVAPRDAARAVQLAAAAEAYREEVGALPEPLRRGFDDALAAARHALGAEAADSARRQGRSLGIDEAIALARPSAPPV